MICLFPFIREKRQSGSNTLVFRLLIEEPVPVLYRWRDTAGGGGGGGSLGTLNTICNCTLAALAALAAWASKRIQIPFTPSWPPWLSGVDGRIAACRIGVFDRPSGHVL